MDPTKSSLSLKAPYVNSGRGNESPLEDGSALWQDTLDGDADSRDADVFDGSAAAAETNHNHKGSADKHRFSTMGYQRRTKQKVVTDFATLSKGTSAGGRPRAALRQALFSQGGSDKNPPSEERGHLDVLKQALQAYAVPASLKWDWKGESQGTTLERTWTDLVHSHSVMTKIKRHQQEALWEFVHTELTYINKLLIIKDLVIAALVNLHQHGFLLEVTPELLFSNLPFILSAHQLFWQDVIYPMLHEVRRTGEPFDPLWLEAGCLQFHKRFFSYKHYCWEEENNLEFTRRQLENNPHFQTYVQWVETHPQCERMRLGDMQAKPHQRITKYPLLLKAVLRTTQDIRVQHTLRGMLSSVNDFLESINDYLRLKDEELALSISAQRMEGYEVEGINEEIDKHVKEVCHFDLTCPISGVGPNVVRKLLLEGNLKLRGRKDSKLDVVALLFSDVLLMTKVQKKGDRLKPVRPPLALDRTCCVTLKDGCSFVLVEVGELQSAMTVYIFSASTADSCTTWVSTIQQAKETLTNLRHTEAKRQQEIWKIQQLELLKGAKIEDSDIEVQSLTESEKLSLECHLDNKLSVPHSINGILETEEEEEGEEEEEEEEEGEEEEEEEEGPPDNACTDNNKLPFCYTQPINKKQQTVHKRFTGNHQAVMESRGDQHGNKMEEEEKMFVSQMTKEERFNHRAFNVDHHSSNASRSLRYNTTGPRTLFLDELPDVDYPTNEDSALQLPHQPAVSWEDSEFHQLPAENRLTRRNSEPMSVIQDTRTNSSESDDTETTTKTWALTKNLKSPGLRRKRPVNILQGPLGQVSNQDSTETSAAAKNSISSNNGSNHNLNTRRNSVPPGQSSDSHRVLKLGSLKPNQGMFWSMCGVASLDKQTSSESELSGPNKRPKEKSRTSALYQPSSNMPTLPQEQDSHLTISEPDSHEPNSILEGLLERAKDRVRERNGFKIQDPNLKHPEPSSPFPPPSPSIVSTTSDGDRETEWGEKEVTLTRHRASTVSERWKEQLVDEDDDEKRNGVLLPDGINVDWPGWCFDDYEVMYHLGGEGLLEDISRSLNFLALQEHSEHEDGECSHV